ncbi:MAG: hypothetical protein HKN23_16370 [Verrucomicrobiales bacterium]|nr:hypothetical protein [Verrucomicrobiales bacterium]
MSEGKSSSGVNTGTIALIIASILLVVVGAMSYHDYMNRRFEEKWSEREQQNPNGQKVQNQNNPNPNQAQPPNYQQNPNNLQVASNGNPGAQFQQQPNQVYPGQAIPPNWQGTPTPNPNLQSVSANPANPNPANAQGTGDGSFNPFNTVKTPDTGSAEAEKEDPDLERYRKALDQQRKEAEIARQQLENLKNGTASPSTPPNPNSANSALPNPASTALVGPPSPAALQASGGNVQIPKAGWEVLEGLNPAELQKMGDKLAAELQKESSQRAANLKRILDAPALAKVKYYDSDWNYVIIDGGSDQNIAVDQRFTLRRGKQVMGVVVITEVNESDAIGELSSRNARKDSNLKPQVGDELIAQELF